MPEIEHTADCEREWLLWGECFHNADGKRIPILHAVRFKRE